ncbi:phage major tail tube protein [Paenibacillus hubeiensis]|uniref:phage major tail tube protein n=1 Tax=Paenibacillus hubeiensis TaxID=3077330 RepID=UPI0031BA9910
MGQIPQKLIDYAVYRKGTNNQLGTADITLPSFEAMTTETSGAGIMGTLEVPTPGQFGSQTLGIAWNTMTVEAAEMMGAGSIDIEIRGAQQNFDTATGQIVYEPIKIVFRGLGKTYEGGTVTKNESLGASTELELLYYKSFLNNQEIFEVDKMGYVFKIRGVSQNDAIKKALGFL